MPINPEAIEKEILAGFPNEKGELEKRQRRNRAYEGDFAAEMSAWPFKPETRRESRIMRRVVEVLSGLLYKDGPTRQLGGAKAASAWLERIYSEHAVDALLQEADALALVNEVAAIEVYGAVGEESLESPLGFNVWGADSLLVWLDPDNCRRPGAVGVLDEFDESRRLRLWTRDELRTYQTGKAGLGRTAGGTAYRRSARRANPYGILPFAFVHANYPARHFWSNGPGEYLRKLNYHINYRLSKIADDVIHNRPIGVLRGTAAGWNFPSDRVAGEFTAIPTGADAAGAGPETRAEYIVCDLGYLGEDLKALQADLEHSLQMIGVPGSAIRMEQSGVASGVALVVEQIPLVEWAERRQRPFARYERQLARVTLTVASAHAESNAAAGYGDVGELLGIDPAELRAALEDLRFNCRYPDLRAPMPGPQRDAADQFRLDSGLTCRVELLRERERLTEAEAKAKFRRIAKLKEWENTELGIPDWNASPEGGAETTDDDQTNPTPGADDQGADPTEEDDQ